MPQETTIGSAILTSATPKTPGADESPTGSQPGMLGSSGGPWDRGAGMGMFGRGQCYDNSFFVVVLFVDVLYWCSRSSIDSELTNK